MSEATAVQNANLPRTRESLAADLRALGLRAGMVVLVHSSLSALGWVCGGPVAVIQALCDVLTEAGTLIMPTFTGDLSEPSYWQNPPVPAEWWPIIRGHMPAFDPRLTPTRQMGQIAESFRQWPGVRRSYHPTTSFAAWGRHAEDILRGQTLSNGLGEQSPLARIYQLDGYVLLLGVGYGNNTSFHLGEFRSGVRVEVVQGSPILAEDGSRRWVTYPETDWNDSDFEQIGQMFEAQNESAVTMNHVGSAQVRFFRQRPAVDFAENWLRRHRAETPA